jgi:arsenate reductase
MPQTKGKLKILFLCTGNSCRSQMAEGWAKYLKMDLIDAYSAGVSPKPLDPRAVTVMAEAGVDISNHHSKHIDELRNIQFDFVVTVCDSAHESCPIFSGKTKILHIGSDDPPRLAEQAKTEQDALNFHRRVRDEIKAFIDTLPDSLTKD